MLVPSLRRLNSVVLTPLELFVERTWRSLKKWARESLRHYTWRSVGDSGNNNYLSNETGRPSTAMSVRTVLGIGLQAHSCYKIPA